MTARREVRVVIECDEMRCPASFTAPTGGKAAPAREKARAAGWSARKALGDFCPDHLASHVPTANAPFAPGNYETPASHKPFLPACCVTHEGPHVHGCTVVGPDGAAGHPGPCRIEVDE